MKFPVATYGPSVGASQQFTVKVRRLSNDSQYTDAVIGFTPWIHTRGPHTSNPLTPISNTSTMWRNPASYSRNGYIRSLGIIGTHTLGNGTTLYARDSFLNPTSIMQRVQTQSSLNATFGAGFDSPSVSSAHYKNMRSKALTRALSDLGSRKAGLAENLVQMGKTVDSIADIATDVVKVVKALNGLRKGQIKGILDLNARALKALVRNKKVPKRIANYWLSYWYGFKPLYSDAVGLMEILTDLSKPALLIHGRGRADKQGQSMFIGSPVNNLTDPAFSITDTIKLEFECNLTGRLYLNGNAIRALQRASLTDPLGLAWELIPFSFVIDWIVPVGETLAGYSAGHGLRFQGGHITSRYSRLAIGTTAPSHQKGAVALSYIEGFGIDRQVLLTFPVGEFYEKTFFTGASRWATIAALITGATRR